MKKPIGLERLSMFEHRFDINGKFKIQLGSKRSFSETMVPPLLKLEFTQGPRAGESLEYKPGSTIRIGRVVRGNEIAIKDVGISTKHIRIVSDSENWLIHELGSSNGTIINSDTLDADTPVNLRHGDTIKLGEYTSIVVNFVTDVQAQEHKLPPRPRRSNKLLNVPDPDPDPVESVQEKPKRRGRPPKQNNVSSKENGVEHELPKRTRASRKRTVEDNADKEKELEVENEKKVNFRAGRARKKEISAIMKEEEVLEEKSRVRRGKNTESFSKLGLNSIKLEVEDIPKGVEISDRKSATRSKQIENASLRSENDVTVLEEKDEKRTSRDTRSKKTEIGGDSYMDLEMVLNQARKSRAKRKKMEQELSKSVVEMEAKNDDAGEEALNNCHVEKDKDNEAQKGFSGRSGDKEDETEGDYGCKRVDQVEIELRKSIVGEWDLNCSVREDGETENLQETEEESKKVEQVEIESRKKSTLGKDYLSYTVREDGETENLQDTIECEVEESGSDDGCDEEKVEQGSSNKNVERVKVDLGKMTLREWFDFMDFQLPKQIIEETEKMIKPMRSKTMRVHKHISEQSERVV